MKKIAIMLVFLLMLTVFVISGYKIISKLGEDKQAKEQFSQLSDAVGEYRMPDNPADGQNQEQNGDAEMPAAAQAYIALKEQNADFAGWVYVPGTTIDYPVMQTPDTPEYYLEHDFNKDYSAHGTPFADWRADIDAPSDNITIYGHYMKNGAMFADLRFYLDPEFWQEHPLIHFDTIDRAGAYEVFAVFTLSASDPDAYQYHMFVDALSAQEFDAHIAALEELALYDTGITAAYGDELLTLSTCEYTHEDGRLVVVAKRVAQ